MGTIVVVLNENNEYVLVDSFSGQIVSAQESIPKSMNHIGIFHPTTFPSLGNRGKFQTPAGKKYDMVRLSQTGYWTRVSYIPPKESEEEVNEAPAATGTAN